MNLLHSYHNGNTFVSIYDNGTKIREFEGEAKPEFPESMDVKITNFCNNTCQWCHEKSNINGKHADLRKLLAVLEGLPAGVEIAIGGGNPLAHPDLLMFLEELKRRGLIANMTINQSHIFPYHTLIEKLIKENLIRGVGISYSNSRYLPHIEPFIKMTDNIVFHVIIGVNTVEVIEELFDFVKDNGGKTCKILILGYKEYGCGENYYSLYKQVLIANSLWWYRKIAIYFKLKQLVLSFDNLAIEQLNLRRFFLDAAWEKFYMGKEGKHSMFVDAVEQKFAICSVDSNRKSFDEISLLEFFQNIEK